LNSTFFIIFQQIILIYDFLTNTPMTLFSISQTYIPKRRGCGDKGEKMFFLREKKFIVTFGYRIC